LRSELGISLETKLVGLVARFDPQKDHRSFLTALARLGRDPLGVHAVLVGDNMTSNNDELARLIDQAGVRAMVHLLDRRDDVARITAALDVSVCSSAFGEGFPNATAEAMASGVPCVVTDVGDAATLVGDTGRVVPPRRSDRLAEAIGEMLSMEPQHRSLMGAAARARVQRNYALPQIVEQYEQLYESLAQDDRVRQP
jgi:glycosyltransferase involved in cell wall biosynthesis